MCVVSFIQVLPCPPGIGYPQQPGALSTKIKPLVLLAASATLRETGSLEGAFNHRPLTQPPARNECNDVFLTA